MAISKDKIGFKHGRLTVICEAPKTESGTTRWYCRCDCGTEVAIRTSGLGRTRSCGCLQREKAAATGSASKKDLTGLRFGRLIVLSQSNPEEGAGRKRKRVRWVCSCECGAEATANGMDLVMGRTASCGCLQRDRTAAANSERIKHGHSRARSDGSRKNSREYRSYQSMIQRCRNPNAPNFHLYGGRGISICEEWQGEGGFQRFLAYMGPRPPEMTLDRFPDNDGNYEPGNVRWATATEQAATRRQTPEYRAQMRANLDRGRRRMWDEPELRERLIASRRR